MVDDFLSAMKKGNGAAQVAIFQSIFLPEAKSWFQGAFGPEGGAKLGDRYARESTAFPSPFVGIFTVILNEKLTDIEVLRFDKACDARANTYEYPVLAAFERVPKLYAVRASNLSTHKLLKSAFFVYADGGFR